MYSFTRLQGARKGHTHAPYWYSNARAKRNTSEIRMIEAQLLNYFSASRLYLGISLPALQVYSAVDPCAVIRPMLFPSSPAPYPPRPDAANSLQKTVQPKQEDLLRFLGGGPVCGHFPGNDATRLAIDNLNGCRTTADLHKAIRHRPECGDMLRHRILSSRYTNGVDNLLKSCGSAEHSFEAIRRDVEELWENACAAYTSLVALSRRVYRDPMEETVHAKVTASLPQVTTLPDRVVFVVLHSGSHHTLPVGEPMRLLCERIASLMTEGPHAGKVLRMIPVSIGLHVCESKSVSKYSNNDDADNNTSRSDDSKNNGDDSDVYAGVSSLHYPYGGLYTLHGVLQRLRALPSFRVLRNAKHSQGVLMRRVLVLSDSWLQPRLAVAMHGAAVDQEKDWLNRKRAENSARLDPFARKKTQKSQRKNTSRQPTHCEDGDHVVNVFPAVMSESLSDKEIDAFARDLIRVFAQYRGNAVRVTQILTMFKKNTFRNIQYTNVRPRVDKKECKDTPLKAKPQQEAMSESELRGDPLRAGKRLPTREKLTIPSKGGIEGADEIYVRLVFPKMASVVVEDPTPTQTEDLSSKSGNWGLPFLRTERGMEHDSRISTQGDLMESALPILGGMDTYNNNIFATSASVGTDTELLSYLSATNTADNMNNTIGRRNRVALLLLEAARDARNEALGLKSDPASPQKFSLDGSRGLKELRETLRSRLNQINRMVPEPTGAEGVKKVVKAKGFSLAGNGTSSARAQPTLTAVVPTHSTDHKLPDTKPTSGSFHSMLTKRTTAALTKLYAAQANGKKDYVEALPVPSLTYLPFLPEFIPQNLPPLTVKRIGHYYGPTECFLWDKPTPDDDANMSNSVGWSMRSLLGEGGLSRSSSDKTLSHANSSSTNSCLKKLPERGSSCVMPRNAFSARPRVSKVLKHAISSSQRVLRNHMTRQHAQERLLFKVRQWCDRVKRDVALPTTDAISGQSERTTSLNQAAPLCIANDPVAAHEAWMQVVQAEEEAVIRQNVLKQRRATFVLMQKRKSLEALSTNSALSRSTHLPACMWIDPSEDNFPSSVPGVLHAFNDGENKAPSALNLQTHAALCAKLDTWGDRVDEAPYIPNRRSSKARLCRFSIQTNVPPRLMPTTTSPTLRGGRSLPSTINKASGNCFALPLPLSSCPNVEPFGTAQNPAIAAEAPERPIPETVFARNSINGNTLVADHIEKDLLSFLKLALTKNTSLKAFRSACETPITSGWKQGKSASSSSGGAQGSGHTPNGGTSHFSAVSADESPARTALKEHLVQLVFLRAHPQLAIQDPSTRYVIQQLLSALHSPPGPDNNSGSSSPKHVSPKERPLEQPLTRPLASCLKQSKGEPQSSAPVPTSKQLAVLPMILYFEARRDTEGPPSTLKTLTDSSLVVRVDGFELIKRLSPQAQETLFEASEKSLVEPEQPSPVLSIAKATRFDTTRAGCRSRSTGGSIDYNGSELRENAAGGLTADWKRVLSSVMHEHLNLTAPTNASTQIMLPAQLIHFAIDLAAVPEQSGWRCDCSTRIFRELFATPLQAASAPNASHDSPLEDVAVSNKRKLAEKAGAQCEVATINATGPTRDSNSTVPMRIGSGRRYYPLDMHNLHIAASLAAEEIEKVLIPCLEQLRSRYREQRNAMLKAASRQPKGEDLKALLHSPNTEFVYSEAALQRAVHNWTRLFLPLLRTEGEYAQQLAQVRHHEYLIYRFNFHVELFNAHEAQERRRWAPMYRKSISIAYLLCKFIDEHGLDGLPQHYIPLLAPVAFFAGCMRGYRELLSKLKEVISDLVERAKRVQVYTQDLLPSMLEDAAKVIGQGRGIASDIVSCQATEKDVIGFPLACVQMSKANLQNAPFLCGDDC